MPEFTPKYYTFYRNGTPERVREEIWKWEAYYIDGTFLHQFDDATNQFHQLQEIDQKRLATFKMVSRKFPDRSYTLLFNPARWQLIHFYKRTRLNMGAVNDTGMFTLYVFGYKNLVNDVSIQNLNVITPSGEMITTDNLTRLKIT